VVGEASGFKKRYAEPIERHGDGGATERLRTYTAVDAATGEDRLLDHLRPSRQSPPLPTPPPGLTVEPGLVLRQFPASSGGLGGSR
jgi:hypothetical protein